MKKSLLLLIPILFLSACASSLLKSDAPVQRIYSLRAAEMSEPPSDTENGISKTLEIQRPSLPPGFDTARIAMYLENGRRLDYYADAKWPSPLDEVLQEFTAQTARKALPTAIIAAPGQAIDTDYRLQIRVNDFQPVYAGGPDRAPLLVASLTFTLLGMPNEMIVTSFTVDQQITAQSNDLTSVTAGMEYLLRSVQASAFATIGRRINQE